MNISSAQLMKLLASGVRPSDGPGVCNQASPAGATPFADLLKQAQQGDLISQLPVTIASDADGVNLDSDQLARLSFAADKLETAGVRNALVSIDGQKLLLDVHARQIVGAAPAENGITSGIDGTLDLGDLRGGTSAASQAQQSPGSAGSALGGGSLSRKLPVPSASLTGNPDVLKLLAQLTENSAA